MTAPLLTLDRLTVAYGGAPAVDGVSLSVAPGEVVALLGPNGAGKSSLLKAVIGLVPSTGRLTFAGADLSSLPPERRARLGLGYVPEGRRVFPGMSVRDNLEVASRAPAAARAQRLERIFALFPQLRTKSADRAWQLSGGQQQMLAIGRALMGEPRLLLLDEPSLGLSPRLAAEVLATVRTIAAAGTAVLIAEQTAARALDIADRAALLRLGRLIRIDSAAALRQDSEFSSGFFGESLANDGSSR